jgi:hypothetical protein
VHTTQNVVFLPVITLQVIGSERATSTLLDANREAPGSSRQAPPEHLRGE